MELIKTSYTKSGSKKVSGFRVDVSAIYKADDDKLGSAQAQIYDDTKTPSMRVGYATLGNGTTVNINSSVPTAARTAIIEEIMNVFDTL